MIKNNLAIIIAIFFTTIANVYGAGEPLTVNAPLNLGNGYSLSAGSFADRSAPNTYFLTPGATGMSLQLAGAVNVAGLSIAGSTISATPTQLNYLDSLSGRTGTGSLVLSTSPTLTTPVLGTPTSVTLTNATGLPISTGVSGLGTGVATFLGTPSSANLATALTNETGSGSVVYSTSPSLTTPSASSPTFTGSVTLPGTGVWDSSGNVGIGISPSTKLHVLAGGTSSVVTLQNSAGSGVAGVDSNGIYMQPSTASRGVWFYNTAGTSYFGINGSTGRTGVNNGSPTYQLDVSGDINASTYLRAGGYAMRAAGTTYGTYDLMTTKGGYYGINFGGGTGNPNLMADGSGNIGIYYQSASEWLWYSTVSNKYIGIGTTTPGSKLQVTGGGFPLRLQYSTSEAWQLGPSASGTNNFAITRSSDTLGMFITYSSPNGWTYTSDARTKKNISPITSEESNKVISSLNPIHYNWKDTKLTSQKQSGFIAQEIKPLVPEAVSLHGESTLTLPNGSKETIKDTLGMSQEKLIPYMIKYMQTQQKEIDKLSQEVEDLKAVIKTLK